MLTILAIALLFTVWTTPGDWKCTPSMFYRCIPWIGWALAISAECFTILVLERGWP